MSHERRRQHQQDIEKRGVYDSHLHIFVANAERSKEYVVHEEQQARSGVELLGNAWPQPSTNHIRTTDIHYTPECERKMPHTMSGRSARNKRQLFILPQAGEDDRLISPSNMMQQRLNAETLPSPVLQ